MKGYKTTYIDIMVNEIFDSQLRYEYNPLWKIDMSDVFKFVFDKKPDLKKKKFTIAFSDQRIPKR